MPARGVAGRGGGCRRHPAVAGRPGQAGATPGLTTHVPPPGARAERGGSGRPGCSPSRPAGAAAGLAHSRPSAPARLRPCPGGGGVDPPGDGLAGATAWPHRLPPVTALVDPDAGRGRCAIGSTAAAAYVREARLQRGVARRLAGLWRCTLANRLPPGPRLDLGGGAGALARALARQGCPPLQVVDRSASLLRLATGLQVRPWDLERGLPVAEPALLASSFALHWLAQPLESLGQWCRALRPGGQLLLAVPTSGSFTSWRQATRQAGVPWTGLPLPSAQPLQEVLASHLQLHHCRLLQRRQGWPSALAFFQHLKRSGLTGGASSRLGPGELRRLDRCWPRGPQGRVIVEWEVLMVVAEKPGDGVPLKQTAGQRHGSLRGTPHGHSPPRRPPRWPPANPPVPSRQRGTSRTCSPCPRCAPGGWSVDPPRSGPRGNPPPSGPCPPGRIALPGAGSSNGSRPPHCNGRPGPG
ncbi:MAG: methyltransferase domain-containing protein [Synechococcus sp. SB0668_bin_15]|nr:methyltransferase domain-containing protein [Synechococcus sp. SB0668_bin_15]MYC49518.1 methyltransferase domain-containing protein [Synechococcus sp. SB0662_bin_14]